MEPPPRTWGPSATPARVTAVAVVGVVGVVAYVAAWGLGGMLWEGYDPAHQAISELFALQAPARTRLPLSVGLVLSGLGLLAFAWLLDAALPGRGRSGPALAGLSGAMTIAIVAVPCTAGCPGFGTSTTDTLHVVVAGTGYITLVLAPLAIGWRVRAHLPGLAVTSWVLGGGALLAFGAHTLGTTTVPPGLLQRTFNTTADLWYVVAAVVVVRRSNGSRGPVAGDPARPGR